MKSLNLSQLVKISAYFNCARNQIMIHLDLLRNELANFNLDVKPVIILYEHLATLEYIEQWFEFLQTYKLFKQTYDSYINKIFYRLNAKDDFNLYLLYNYFYHIDALIVNVEKWNEISFDNIEKNEEIITMKYIWENIKYEMRLDFKEFNKISATYDFYNKVEESLLNDIVNLKEPLDYENSIGDLIEIFEYNNPIKFNNNFSREKQTAVLSAYYLLIKNLALVSMVCDFDQNNYVSVLSSQELNKIMYKDNFGDENVTLTTDNIDMLKEFILQYKNKKNK